MWFGVVTLFPEMFSTMLKYGVCGKAIRNRKVEVDTWNPRDFSQDKHCTVDSKPYGGGPGMLMQVQPLSDAIRAARRFSGNKAKVIYLSPQGKLLNHSIVQRLSQEQQIILVSGRYEGVDERVVDEEVDEELSIGDYVLSGGELPAMVLIDTIARLVPGVLGCIDSVSEDSFYNGLLDYPHYTNPRVSEGRSVPEVLLSGNHAKIRVWRLKQALGKTWRKRPDLLKGRLLTDEEEDLLAEYISES